MSEKINWILNIQVIGGPRISESKTMEVEAYDKIEVKIDNGASDREIEVSPGEGTVQFLLIKTDHYGNGLQYKVNNGSTSSNPIILDEPVHLFMGAGSVGSLGIVPIKLLFTNELGEDVLIHILIGRDATPNYPTP